MENTSLNNDQALVYLLGAGASYPALPLARDVSQGMVDWGKKCQTFTEGISEPELKNNLLGMSEELISWGTISGNHYSIDTLAKKLFLTTEHKDLWKLKAAMSAFFMLQQAACPAEQRYDSLFAAIMEQPGRPPKLPDYVWILTWNYDRQLERAYHQYCGDSRTVQQNITFCQRVVRLNGLLGRAINKGTGGEYNLNFDHGQNEVFDEVAREYWQLRNKEPTITFAFEKGERLDTELRGLADKKCILVVIGYSFPFFNRRFDKLVLDSIPKVDKVYLQVLPEHTKAIESRIKSMRKDLLIEPINDQEQFYVPYLPI